MLSDLIDPGAVRRAIAEYDALGREAFLEKYGFGPARQYFLLFQGRRYDSKAIVGAAHGFQNPDRGPLTSSDFSAGDSTVVRVLQRLGFEVVDTAAVESRSDSLSLSATLSEVCDLLQARDAASPDFSQDRLSSLVRQNVPGAVRSYAEDRVDINGRTGIGTAADVPWVGLFPRGSEPSAKHGFYLVYLFAKDGSACYLSLNQGTEDVRGGLEVLQKRALDLRRSVGLQDDLLRAIDLKSENTCPLKYEAGSAYALHYSASAFPAEAHVAADLRRMLDLLDRASSSGLHWDPELEPLHLVFKWNADREPRTIDLHKALAESENSVWWGRFSTSPTPSIGKSNLQRLQDQLARGLVTHAYLYRRGSCWQTVVHEVRVDPPPMPDSRFPAYYAPSDCNFFARVSGFRELEPSWLLDNAVLASHPDADPRRLAGALGNQTTPLFIYELGGSVVGDAASVAVLGDAIDLAEVNLAEVCKDIATQLQAAGLDYGTRHEQLVRSAVVSLATKRFLLLTGLSGSGKTRLGIALGQWFGADRLKVVPVRPDWTGPDALLGFENGLSPAVDGRHAWTAPETLQFILRAARDPENPYLLLLDEMNLAHVERYFADVLSGMESQTEVIPNLVRRAGEWRLDEPPALPFPRNLFLVGTVNIDETTYMFSPKVLDRANTIEFRVLSDDLDAAAVPPSPVDPGDAALVRRFWLASTTVIDDDWPGKSQLGDWLRSLHSLLSEFGREFGHRVFFEALRFGSLLTDAGEDDVRTALDLQVMQKVLPRLYGSIRELAEPLNALGSWCFNGPDSEPSSSFDPLSPSAGTPLLPVSFDKIQRMTRRLRAHHFASFAE